MGITRINKDGSLVEPKETTGAVGTNSLTDFPSAPPRLRSGTSLRDHTNNSGGTDGIEKPSTPVATTSDPLAKFTAKHGWKALITGSQHDSGSLKKQKRAAWDSIAIEQRRMSEKGVKPGQVVMMHVGLIKRIFSHIETNEWTGISYLEGKLLERGADELLAYYEEIISSAVVSGVERAKSQIRSFMATKTYNPGMKYLKGLMSRVALGLEPLEAIDTNNLASRFLGTTNPLYDVLLKKHLLGAIARWDQPGCQFDRILVLQGAQGLFKDRFIRALSPTLEMFNEVTAAQPEVEMKRVIGASGIVNITELDSVIRSKDIEGLKALITATQDSYRKMRQDYSGGVLRHCALFGSCNQATFLNDPTGSRRFAVIELPTETVLDIKGLEAVKDALWYSLYIEYLEKVEASEDYIWWLSPEEKEQLAKANQVFQIVDPLEELIQELLGIVENLVGTNGLLKPKDVRNWLSSNGLKTVNNQKLGTLMAKAGYKYGQARFNGKNVKTYRHHNLDPSQASLFSRDDASLNFKLVPPEGLPLFFPRI